MLYTTAFKSIPSLHLKKIHRNLRHSTLSKLLAGFGIKTEIDPGAVQGIIHL
jgi:hypothetical protein